MTTIGPQGLTRWNEPPVAVKGGSEAALPEECFYCGGELCYWERWMNEPASYRCFFCGQPYRLTGPFVRPAPPVYD